ncbi:MAG: hypothetical protein ACKV2Q_27525 [Planctomycetaceae bacterium]
MRVIQQLIDYYRHSKHWSDDLESRLLAVGLIGEFDDRDDFEPCDDCHSWPSPVSRCCYCNAWYDELLSEELRWEAADVADRARGCRRRRGKRGRRREATVKDVRLALAQRFGKWSLPGGRLAHLREVGGLLTPCGTWQKAAWELLSEPVPRLVERLRQRVRFTARPLLNRLTDFDLVLRSFSRPWRGQAGAALRRLVEQRPDSRSRKLLKYPEFQDVALLVELAEHSRQARQHCLHQRRSVLRLDVDRSFASTLIIGLRRRKANGNTFVTRSVRLVVELFRSNSTTTPRVRPEFIRFIPLTRFL